MSDIDALLDRYLAQFEAVAAATRGMSRDQATARPIAGKWSTLEVVCHLADFEPILEPEFPWQHYQDPEKRKTSAKPAKRESVFTRDR